MPSLVDVAPGSPEWLAARRGGVTATDIVTICGLSSTDSAYALYWRKLGVLPDSTDSDRFRLGRELEPYIAARWAEAHPGEFMTDGPLLFRSYDRPWQMATIDREILVGEPSEFGEMRGLPVELKSWADAGRKQWDDGPPPAVRAQVLWQMDVMGVSTGHVAVLFLPSGEFRSFTVVHDPSHDAMPDPLTGLVSGMLHCQVCDDLEVMRAAGHDFMLRLGSPDDPPSPDGSAATLAALKARFADPRSDKTAPVPLELWNPWYGACEEAARWKITAKAYEAEIRELIGEAGIIEVGGEVVARRQRYTVKAHQRKESTVDKLVRVTAREESDD